MNFSNKNKASPFLKEKGVELTELFSYIYSNRKEEIKRILASKFPTPIHDVDWNDIFQEAATITYEKIRDGEFNGTSRVETYLIGVGINLVHQIIRKRSIENKHISKISDYLRQNTASNTLPYGIDRSILYLILDELNKEKDNCGEIIRMYMKSYPDKVVAERLNISNHRSVSVMRKRCFDKFTEKLEKLKKLGYVSL